MDEGSCVDLSKYRLERANKKIIAILRPYLEKRWTEIEKGEIE